MRKLITLTLFIIFTSHLTYSQQIPLFTQYYLNNFFYNPAKAGSGNSSQAFVTLRKQWVNIPDAPQSALLTFEAPVKQKKVGLGLTIYNDVLSIVGRTGIFGTYAYTFELASDQLLSFGLSAGINQNKIFFDRIKADDLNELSWLSNLDTKAKIDGNFGINYTKERFEAGLSCYQLLNSSFKYTNNTLGKEVDYKLVRHYFASVKYSLYYDKWDGFHIDPMIFIRTAEGMPMQFEGSVVCNYKDKAWLGLMYRQNFGLCFLAGVELYDKLTIGYSYDYSMGDISKYAGGTHEIVLGYKFLRQSPTGIEPITDYDQNKINKAIKAQNEKIDQLSMEVEKLRQANKPNEEQLKALMYNFSVTDTSKGANLTGRQVFIQQYDSNGNINQQLKSMQAEIDKLKQNKNLTDDEIRDMIKNAMPGYAATGKNKNVIGQNNQKLNDYDLGNGDYYVIVGCYYTETDAKAGQEILQKALNLNTSMMVKTFKGTDYYNIYTKKVTSFKEFQEESDKLNSMDIKKYIWGNVWLLGDKK